MQRAHAPVSMPAAMLIVTSSLVLAGASSLKAPTTFTKNLDMQGVGCPGITHTMLEYQSNTADGRPWYAASLELFSVDTGKKVFVFYDKNCDGKTGAAHSQHGHPQWVFSGAKPSQTRSSDLDSNGECIRDTNKGSAYTLGSSESLSCRYKIRHTLTVLSRVQHTFNCEILKDACALEDPDSLGMKIAFRVISRDDILLI